MAEQGLEAWNLGDDIEATYYELHDLDIPRTHQAWQALEGAQRAYRGGDIDTAGILFGEATKLIGGLSATKDTVHITLDDQRVKRQMAKEPDNTWRFGSEHDWNTVQLEQTLKRLGIPPAHKASKALFDGIHAYQDGDLQTAARLYTFVEHFIIQHLATLPARNTRLPILTEKAHKLEQRIMTAWNAQLRPGSRYKFILAFEKTEKRQHRDLPSRGHVYRVLRKNLGPGRNTRPRG